MKNFGATDDVLDRYDVRMRLPRKRRLPSTMAGTANKKRKITFEPTRLLKLKLTRRKYSRLVLISAIRNKSGILCLKLIIL